MNDAGPHELGWDSALVIDHLRETAALVIEEEVGLVAAEFGSEGSAKGCAEAVLVSLGELLIGAVVGPGVGAEVGAVETRKPSRGSCWFRAW